MTGEAFMSNPERAFDLDRFNEDIQRFCDEQGLPEVREAVASGRKITRELWAAWQYVMSRNGFGAPAWPREYGGPGWGALQRLSFSEIIARNNLLQPYHHNVGHIGPVIIKYGTSAQRERFLPRIVDGSEWWCQGYSEPNAGSDLASLRTAAIRDGNEYVINGQKIWSSHAHEADFMYTLVRTSSTGRKQEGISMILVPLNTPGITIREIRTIDGFHTVNEVFFEEARVPTEYLVGNENEGWEYSKYLLSFERIGAGNTAPLIQQLEPVESAVSELAAEFPEKTNLRLIANEISSIKTEISLLRHYAVSVAEAADAGSSLTYQPSILKLKTSHISQRIEEIATSILDFHHYSEYTSGMNRLPDVQKLQNYFYGRAKTIYGGTSEIQRELISRQIFRR